MHLTNPRVLRALQQILLMYNLGFTVGLNTKPKSATDLSREDKVDPLML